MSRKNIYKINLSDSNYFHTHYDQCTFPKCSYRFQEADWTYFGKDSDGNWQHVCENHRNSFQWVILQVFGHMPKEIYRVEPYTIPCYKDPVGPDTDLWLWRYMSFYKFKDFIKTKSLFFPYAHILKRVDPLECAVSIENNRDWLHQLRTNAYPVFYASELDGLSEEEKRVKIEMKIKMEIESNLEFSDKALINCWHANDYESVAMWKLYSGDSRNRTIAISMNMCNLRDALPKPIHIGEVAYESYEKVYPTKIRAFKKHISYAHENEIRAVVFPEHINNKKIMDIVTTKENGLLIKLDERYLDVRVYLSPWGSKRFKQEVKKLICDSDDWNKENGPNPSLKLVPTKYGEPIY